MPGHRNWDIIDRAIVEYSGKYPNSFAPLGNLTSERKNSHQAVSNKNCEVNRGIPTIGSYREMMLNESFNSARDFRHITN